MGNRKKQIIPGALGNQGPFFSPPPVPIIFPAAPDTTDEADALGQIGVVPTTGAAYICAAQDSGVTTWVGTSAALGGNPSVSSLTITGAMPGSLTINNLQTGVLISNNPTSISGVIQSLNLAADGSLLIGNSGNIPSVAQLTAGSGININNGAGTITISATGTGLAWATVTGATNSPASNTGKFANRAGSVTFTLPATATIGDEISLIQINTNAAAQIIVQAGGTSVIAGLPGMAASSAGGTLTGPAFNAGGGNMYSSVILVSQTTGANPSWFISSLTGAGWVTA